MLSQGRTNEAMDLLNEALQIAANDISSRELLSRLLISGQQYQQAEQMLIKGLELTPGQPLLTRLFARTKIDQGQDRLAIAILDQADSNYTLDAESKALLAGLYQRTGRYQDSASYYQRALAIQPDQGKWWLGLGIALEAQSDWAASSHAYQRAISSTQLEPRLRHYAQQRLQSSHEHQPAIH